MSKKLLNHLRDNFLVTRDFFILLTAVNVCRQEAELAGRLPVFPDWVTVAITGAFTRFSDSLTLDKNFKTTLNQAFGVTAGQKKAYAADGNIGFMIPFNREGLYRTADNIKGLFGIDKKTSLQISIEIQEHFIKTRSDYIVNTEPTLSFGTLYQGYIRRKSRTEIESTDPARETFLSALPETLRKKINNAPELHSRKPRRNPSR
ncbi:MAG: hypothetical protein EG824_06870 [Deltaproteobacteria bacterium]|nr:hypothetical protein [Deltaproteobacteria bacterium]